MTYYQEEISTAGVLQIRVRYNLILAENAHSAQGQTGDGEAAVMAGRMAARRVQKMQQELWQTTCSDTSC